MKHNLDLKSSFGERKSIAYTLDRLKVDAEVPILLYGIWQGISNISVSWRAIDIEIIDSKYPSSCSRKLTSVIFIHELSEAKINSSKFMRFVNLLRVLICRLGSESSTSVRDIFYRDVQLYGSQVNLDKLLSTASRMLDCLIQSQFKIFSSAKGLVWGSPKFEVILGEESYFLRTSNEPVLIPSTSSCLARISPKPDVIVVFEKDAVLKQFCSHRPRQDLSVIALTGKGFPDRGSKSFLQAIRNAIPDTPILVFTDSDVYGLQIFWQYTSIFTRDLPSSMLSGVFILEYSTGWLSLKNREWLLMIAFLKRLKMIKSNQGSSERNLCLVRRELRRGLLLHKKAEMNIIGSDVDAGLIAYLWGKIDMALRTGDLT